MAASAFAEETTEPDTKFGEFTRTEAQFLVGDGFEFGSNAPDTNAAATLTINHFTRFTHGDLFFFIDFARELDGSKNNSGYGEVYAALDLSKLFDDQAAQRWWNLSAIAGPKPGQHVRRLSARRAAQPQSAPASICSAFMRLPTKPSATDATEISKPPIRAPSSGTCR